MALTKCGECGGQVSDKAAACPHCGAQIAAVVVTPEARSQPTKTGGIGGALAFVALVMFALILKGCLDDEAPLSARYPDPWRSQAPPEMTRAMVAAGVRGCGEFRFRYMKGGAGAALLACTRDGKEWRAWELFIATEKALGPFELPDDIPPPRP